MGVLCARAIVRVQFPVKQRGKTFEQGRDLLIVQQSRGDEELTGPDRGKGRVALDQSGDRIVILETRASRISQDLMRTRHPLGPIADRVDHRVNGGSHRRGATSRTSGLCRRSR
jgi:hypothetical protein